MQKMSHDEYKQFITTGTKTGKLATVRKDGRPHVAPVWFVVDDDDTLIFMTWHKSVKALNIRRDARVCLCVDDENPPYAFVQIEGIATIINSPNNLLYWSTRIGGRYMGEDLAETYGKRNAVEGELLIRITPTKIIAQKDLAT